MSHSFNEQKSAQAAGRLLQSSGGSAPIMKLVRMLYLADREAILRWGRPITNDRFVFLKHGPVLAQVLELLTEEDDPRQGPSPWSRLIAQDRNGAVDLREPPDPGHLSGEERALLDEIASRHGGKAPWELAGLTRALPEWREPRNGALPFTAQDILAAHRRTPRPGPAEADPEEVYLNIHW